MGTLFNDGKKPVNKITISKGGDHGERSISPNPEAPRRSFAQPSPVAETTVEPKEHASAQDQVEAVERHTTRATTPATTPAVKPEAKPSQGRESKRDDDNDAN